MTSENLISQNEKDPILRNKLIMMDESGLL